MLTLHRNENLFGLSPAVRFVLQSSCPVVYQYPGDELMLLQKLLARLAGLHSPLVMVGAGSTEVLRIALADWLRQPAARLFCLEPVYPPVLVLAGGLAPVTLVPPGVGWRPDLTALRREVGRHDGSAVVYLSNPDCHSGELFSRDELSAWLGNTPPRVRFIIDEAYMEFVPQHRDATLLPCVADFAGRLLVLRTFSKAYGLAGLRIGYGLGDTLPGADALACGVGVLAVRAALEALDDHGWIEHSRCLMLAARTHLQQGLTSLGLVWLNGQGNFVLHTLPAGGRNFGAALRPYGIRVAYPLAGLPGWCRTTVGTIADMNYYLSVLSTLVHED
jgi:histidinol-phosphate aminotransferase